MLVSALKVLEVSLSLPLKDANILVFALLAILINMFQFSFRSSNLLEGTDVSSMPVIVTLLVILSVMFVLWMILLVINWLATISIYRYMYDRYRSWEGLESKDKALFSIFKELDIAKLWPEISGYMSTSISRLIPYILLKLTIFMIWLLTSVVFAAIGAIVFIAVMRYYNGITSIPSYAWLILIAIGLILVSIWLTIAIVIAIIDRIATIRLSIEHIGPIQALKLGYRTFMEAPWFWLNLVFVEGMVKLVFGLAIASFLVPILCIMYSLFAGVGVAALLGVKGLLSEPLKTIGAVVVELIISLVASFIGFIISAPFASYMVSFSNVMWYSGLVYLAVTGSPSFVFPYIQPESNTEFTFQVDTSDEDVDLDEL